MARSDIEITDLNDRLRAEAPASPSGSVPFRMQQVLISWIFIFASVTLLLDFLALQDLVRTPLDGVQDWFAELCNWFGVASCLAWLLGFLLLVHWLHSVGASSLGLVGAYFKIVASVLFNLQPMTGTMNDPLLGGSAGLWWSNMAGITMFHIGNIVSCTDFTLQRPPGYAKGRGIFFIGNLPVTGMWTYQLATWFLFAANLLSCQWDGNRENAFLPTSHGVVYTCQVVGSLALVAGSVAYGVWCDAFRNWSH